MERGGKNNKTAEEKKTDGERGGRKEQERDRGRELQVLIAQQP